MNKILLALAAALLFPCLAQARSVYYCTDQSGKTTFQDTPCPELASSTGNYAPLAAKVLTPQIALDSVTRFNLALSKRDAKSAVPYIGKSFVAINMDNPRRQISADIMRELIQRVVDGVSTMDSKVNCKEPEMKDNGSAVVSCLTMAKASFHARSNSGQTLDVYTVIIEEGKAKFSRLESRGVDK